MTVVRLLFARATIFAGNIEVNIGRGDPALHHARTFHRPTRYRNRPQRALDRIGIGPGVNERTEQHIAARAADHFNIRCFHRACTPRILCASAAAPKPLSMLTTAMPGAHDASIASNAAYPPSETP